MAGTLPIVFSRDVAGPMTKCAHDAALLLSVIAGPDVDDPNSKQESISSDSFHPKIDMAVLHEQRKGGLLNKTRWIS
jgi:amidase